MRCCAGRLRKSTKTLRKGQEFCARTTFFTLERVFPSRFQSLMRSRSPAHTPVSVRRARVLLSGARTLLRHKQKPNEFTHTHALCHTQQYGQQSTQAQGYGVTSAPAQQAQSQYGSQQYGGAQHPTQAQTTSAAATATAGAGEQKVMGCSLSFSSPAIYVRVGHLSASSSALLPIFFLYTPCPR